ncbi:hypothetical protein BC827DRAFT_1134608 [Russula dissimulans]|nr:hypothetical protein BC827DRAFT_1134608 [Russula dissimulans]
MSAPLSVDDEALLYTTNAKRERYESLATLYGIIVALDYLNADTLATWYSPACTRLLSQFKTVLKLVGDDRDVPSIELYMLFPNMDHPAAFHRLKVRSREAGLEIGKWVAETTLVSFACCSLL